VTHGAFVCVARLILACSGAFLGVTCTCVCGAGCSCVWHDSFICMTRLIPVCSGVLLCGTWRISACDLHAGDVLCCVFLLSGTQIPSRHTRQTHKYTQESTHTYLIYVYLMTATLQHTLQHTTQKYTQESTHTYLIYIYLMTATLQHTLQHTTHKYTQESTHTYLIYTYLMTATLQHTLQHTYISDLHVSDLHALSNTYI